MHRRRATVAAWQHLINGNVKRLAVANGPNIFQMLLVNVMKRNLSCVNDSEVLNAT